MEGFKWSKPNKSFLSIILDDFEYFLAMVVYEFYRTGNYLSSVPTQDQLFVTAI